MKLVISVTKGKSKFYLFCNCAKLAFLFIEKRNYEHFDITDYDTSIMPPPNQCTVKKEKKKNHLKFPIKF